VRDAVAAGLLALSLVFLATEPAAAQDPEEFTRPCQRADLIGVWHVLRFGFAAGAAVDRTDPAYQPHQRYVFRPDATMSYVASPKPLAARQERALARTGGSETWAVEESGRLTRQSAGAPRVEASECRVMTRAVTDPRGSQPTALPGDVLLTEHDADDRPKTRRLLRRINAAE
jgi:hypothetical protein